MNPLKWTTRSVIHVKTHCIPVIGEVFLELESAPNEKVAHGLDLGS